MISIDNLVKKYGKLAAVDNISLNIHPGEITILLGPNGAGKSTTIKCIAGLLKHEGSILINGDRNKSIEAKRILGYVPEIPALYDLLTIWEHAEFVARAYRLEDGWQVRVENFLKRFEIWDKKDKLVRELSKGMMQKVSITLALMIEPEAVLFDEPLIGLDPKAINEMLDEIQELKNLNKAILISTHIIDTVKDIWDRAYIMNEGKIIYETRRSSQDKKELKEIFFEMTEGC